MPNAAAGRNSPAYARDVLALPHQLKIVIADLGSARCGDPYRRCPVEANTKEEKGVVEGTLWYRAPEVLAGNTRWSFAVDCWAIGCIAVELVLAEPLFRDKYCYLLLLSQIKLFGYGATAHWLGNDEYPHYPQQAPNFPGTWPPPSLRDERICLIATRLLAMCPQKRLTMSEAVTDKYFTHACFQVMHNMRPASRGLVTIAEASLDEDLIRYLQGDPWLTETAQRFKK